MLYHYTQGTTWCNMKTGCRLFKLKRKLLVKSGTREPDPPRGQRWFQDFVQKRLVETLVRLCRVDPIYPRTKYSSVCVARITEGLIIPSSSRVTQSSGRAALAPNAPAGHTPRTPTRATTNQPPFSAWLVPTRDPPRRNLDKATLLPRGPIFSELPCLSDGSLGAATFCDPSCAFTGEGETCDTGTTTLMELSYMIRPLVISFPPLSGTPDVFAIMKHAEFTQDSSTRSATYKRIFALSQICLLYTSPSPRDGLLSRMPSSA